MSPDSQSAKVWFITGTSSGFGWSFAQAALERGDKVVATARKPEVLAELVDKYGDSVLPLQLDVTDRDRVFETVGEAVDRFGRIDVVINNAGYGLQGAVEEISEAEARAQMETNFFGVLWVTQAVLPQLRSQGSGHILNVSSIGGIAAFPGLGLYHASKWAIEGMGEALAYEIAGFGINFTSIEPSGFRTKWNNASMVKATPLPAYDDLLAESRKRFSGEGSHVRGNPDLAAELLLKVIDLDNPPLRLMVGNMAYDVAYMRYDERVKSWKEWEAAGRATDDE